jgi:hypothetical protein
MKTYTRAEILSIINPKSADTQTKNLFRALPATEIVKKIYEFANVMEINVATEA